jgi:hypothetical protein
MSDVISLLGVTEAVLRDLIGTRCHTKATLATGTTTGTIKVTNSGGVVYAINGLLYTKATTDSITWGSGLTAITTGASTTATVFYAVCIDASGAITVTQPSALNAAGTVTTNADGTNLPSRTAGTCLLGYIKVVIAVSTTFTPGTTGQAATGITTTYQDAACPPLVDTF